MIKKEDLEHAIICNQDDNILEISQILRDTLSRHLYVVDENLVPIGVISSIDIIYKIIAQEKNPQKTTAKEIMNNKLKSIELNTDAKQAVETMLELETSSLPVIENKKIIGIIEIAKIWEILSKRSQ